MSVQAAARGRHERAAKSCAKVCLVVSFLLRRYLTLQIKLSQGARRTRCAFNPPAQPDWSSVNDSDPGCCAAGRILIRMKSKVLLTSTAETIPSACAAGSAALLPSTYQPLGSGPAHAKGQHSVVEQSGHPFSNSVANGARIHAHVHIAVTGWQRLPEHAHWR